MYEFLRDFAGPIATVIASGAASYVAYRFGSAQAKTARGMLEATRERTVLDLFDRRWQVVEELRSAVSTVLQQPKFPNETMHRYNRACQRADLLFGSEVTEYLEKARKSLVSVRLAEQRGSSSDETIRARWADVGATHFEKVSEFFLVLDGCIRPYMAMHQKLPDR